MWSHQLLGKLRAVTGRKRQLRDNELRDVQQASYLMHRMAERQQAHYAACAAEFDLSAAQAKVLMSLQPQDAVPMRVLAELVGSDPSNLTGLVDKLEARGALRRVPDPADRRVKTLRLSQDGQRLRDAFWTRLTHDAGPLAPLSPDQVRQLRVLLDIALNQPEP
jgi:DNA-binding MarR family transcriptional regulator